jgi:hypothetical protein
VGNHKYYKGIEIILDTRKEVDLELNAKETKYIPECRIGTYLKGSR